MAAIPITLDGVLYDLYNRTTQRVILIGDASLTGVGIGGGPIPPSGQPPSVWPPPQPSHPIVLPGDPSWPPGTQPPSVWPGPGPSHPIMLPGMPGWGTGGTPPPPEGGAGKPPPPDGGWGYHPEWGWGYFPAGGKPQPIPPAK